MSDPILCSGCFIKNCMYNAQSNISEVNSRPILKELLNRSKVFYFCPEEYGGLATPREPARICGASDDADGDDVLDGKAKVITDDGHDVTKEYIKGAKEAVSICKKQGIRLAILKRTSPSCGYNRTQGGTRERKKIDGDGVTAAALIRAGIKVVSEKEFLEED